MSEEMSKAEAIAALDAIVPGLDEATGRFADTEVGHAEADKILLRFVDEEVAEAWERVEERFQGFWYA